MAISPITQNISTIPTAGHRGVDAQNVFVTKQEAFQDALTGTLVGQINTLKDQINTVVVGINNSLNSVIDAKQSEDNAKVSELNAKQSEDNAKVSELNAQAYAGVINPETFVNSKFSIGFIDHTTSTLTCVGDIVRLTFTQDTNIYKYAVPYEFTQGTILEINVSTYTKGFWIILNELTRALEVKTTTPDFDSDILVSWIYRNATDGIIWRNDERHLCSRNVEWHKSHHLETGAVLISEGNLNYTLNDPSNLALGISTPIKIADEELFFDITHSNTPTGYFDQVLNSNALIPILYLDNNLEYKSINRTDPSCLYLYDGTRAVYNNNTSGGLVTAPDKSYICYWLVYTTDYLIPVKLILGTEAHSNVSNAEAEVFENLGLNMPEIVGVYKLIIYADDIYTQNPAKAVLHSVYYLKKNESSINPSFTPSNHNSLIGRNEADQHPISSITGLQEALENAININTLLDKPTPVNTDNFAIQETGGDLKKLSFANLKLSLFKSTVFNPSMTGSATLNGSTNNTVQLTNIVPTLALEVGDVIRIEYSGYNKLHTVETITSQDLIIVNYEHSGNRGNGSLKLTNTTTTATITRIAKWYNAPIGLGQAWVVMSARRAFNIAYSNTTGRTIHASILVIGTTQDLENVRLLVGGATILDTGNLPGGVPLSISAPIPVTPSYSLTYEKLTDLKSWAELR